MNTWYECRVKSLKIDENGYERLVNDNILLEAVSFTDAETRINELMPRITKGEFQVKGIKPSNITDIVGEDGDRWYKAKVSLVGFDEMTGREKKHNNYMLIGASDIDESLNVLNERLNLVLVACFVESISLTPIVEVFPVEE